MNFLHSVELVGNHLLITEWVTDRFASQDGVSLLSSDIRTSKDGENIINMLGRVVEPAGASAE